MARITFNEISYMLFSEISLAMIICLKIATNYIQFGAGEPTRLVLVQLYDIL